MAEQDKILIGRDVREQLANDLALEDAALKVLKPGIAVCIDSDDHATRDILERIIVEEEKHVDWIESQLHQIKEMGYENYLTLQTGKDD